jgi:hypothetical protein
MLDSQEVKLAAAWAADELRNRNGSARVVLNLGATYDDDDLCTIVALAPSTHWEQGAHAKDDNYFVSLSWSPRSSKKQTPLSTDDDDDQLRQDRNHSHSQTSLVWSGKTVSEATVRAEGMNVGVAEFLNELAAAHSKIVRDQIAETGRILGWGNRSNDTAGSSL